MSRENDINWYHGRLSRDDAEILLKSRKFKTNHFHFYYRERVDFIVVSSDDGGDGYFIVRDSSSAQGDFVLSLLSNNEVIHYQIFRHGQEEDAFYSIGKNSNSLCYSLRVILNAVCFY
jgi:tyrosine-protein kinase shark